MGLDQYLFRTTKKRMAARDEYVSLSREYSETVDSLLEEPKWKSVIDSLPKTAGGCLELGRMSPDQKKQWAKVRAACRMVAKKIGIAVGRGGTAPVFIPSAWGLTDEDKVEELAYWRKNWELHKYIIDNFWSDKEHDNLIEVFLTRKMLCKIVSDGYTEGFKQALDRWDENCVVFYHPWY